MSELNQTEDLGELLKGKRFAMYTTTAADGRLVSRPMTVQEVEDKVVRFITQADNDVTKESEGQQVNLSFADGGSYISLSGVGRSDDDLTKKQELWNRINEAYAGDAEDPNNVILDVHVSDGEFWESGNAAVRILGLAKAAITGDAPSGEHGTVA